MCFDRRRPNRRRGFSLVEIMIVIVIIGLLAGVVTLNVRRYLVRAKVNVARQEVANISKAIDTFWAEFGRYPTNEEGLDALTDTSGADGEPLLTNPPVDPWGRRYQYNCPAPQAPYEVVCLGADGREGGEGADGDITTADVQAREQP